MLHDSNNPDQQPPREEHKQPLQHKAEILKTDKADTNTNPLHGELSEKPEDENLAVMDQDRSNNKS
ncbi:hypothetical protein [Chitinophaga sancti]|uniref:hypothetical protein n=1 Tax=Chitinophaga sancti TaxID=1004 RepID=UPI003F78B6C6